MKTEYERDLHHTWMVLEVEKTYEEDYQMRMLENNAIPGLLSVRGQGKDDRSLYRYEISGKSSLKARGEKESWRSRELEAFMRQFIKVLAEIGRYLLDVDHLSLDPEHIYLQGEDYYFCYCPGYEGNIRTEFHTLTEYFVRETDYNEKEGIYLSYELHRASMEENYNIEQSLETILERREKELERVSPDHRRESYELAEDLLLDDWAGQQEMTGKVIRERKSVLGFVRERRRRKKRDPWEEWEEQKDME